MKNNNLIQEFSKYIKYEFVKELFHEFSNTISSNWLKDVLKTIIHGARFSEICIACLKNIADPKLKIDLNKINFEQIYIYLINLKKITAKDELLFLVIPQILKSIYIIRSKKRVAHIKINNADKIDAELVVTLCNWVMSQLIIIYHNKNTEEVINLTNSLMERKIPIIEQFEDGEIMILKKGLTFGDELLLVLYQYPKRLSVKELNRMLKPKKSSYVPTYLKNLYNNKLIHLNQNGAIINKNGILEIESKLCNEMQL